MHVAIDGAACHRFVCAALDHCDLDWDSFLKLGIAMAPPACGQDTIR